MPTPRKTTKKTTAKKSTRTSRKRKAKSPKVKLSAKKVYVLSGIIVLLCAASLAVSVVLSAPKTKEQEPPLAQTPASSATQAAQPTPQTAAQPTPQTAPQPAPMPTPTVTQQPQTAKQTPSTAAPPSAPQKPAPVATEPVRPTTPTPATPKPKDALASAKADKPPAQATKPASPAPKPAPFTIPPARNGATLVFIIDDAGLHVNNVKRYTALPFPLAIAVLPHLAQSPACAAAIRADGKELMLHQPMQAHAYPSGTIPDPGPGAVLPDMNTTTIAETIKRNLDSIGPGVKGFNNHEGSLITENGIKMGAVLEVAAERGIYFVDSRTTSQSAVPQAALERDMPYLARYAPFLDNKITRADMLAELYKGLEVANKNGYAIIIGHVDKSVEILPQLLADIYPYLVQQGYRFATPSMLR